MDTVYAHSRETNPEACIVTINFIPSFYSTLSTLSNKFDEKKAIQSHGNQTGNLKVWSVNNVRCLRHENGRGLRGHYGDWSLGNR